MTSSADNAVSAATLGSVSQDRLLSRKVRWPRRVACGHYVLTGQVIIGRGQRWICRDCALAEIRKSAAEVAAPSTGGDT